MRYVLLKKSKVFGALALSMVVSSCSLKSNGQQQTVTIALPGAQISQFQWLDRFQSFAKMTDWMSLAWAGTTTSINLNDTPTALSDFDCFAVNVTGPGIPPDPIVSCSDPNDAPAIFGGFVPNGNSSIDLLVPAGANRSIKILGVKSTLTGCPNLRDLVQSGTLQLKDNVSEFYTIGSANTDIFADTSINIKASFNANSPTTAFNNCQRNDGKNGQHVWNVFAGTGPGSINTTKTVNGTSYIGGHFDYVGPTTLQGAMLSQSNGAIASSSNSPAHINGTVRCSVRDGQGGFYVGGSFSHIESTNYSPPAALIHINYDGSLDPNFVVVSNSAGESVYSCAKDDSTLFLGGNFTGLKLNGNSMTPTNALAAIPLSSPSIFNMGGVIAAGSPQVLSMDIDRVRGKLYVGGTFTLTGVLTGHSNAAAFSTSSLFAADTGWHPDPLGAVNAIYADSASANGYVYLGGPFTSPKSYLFRVNAGGTVDASWTSGMASTVFSIAADSNVYVAAYDISNIPHVYRLDSAGAIAATLFATSGTPEPINSIALATDGSNQLFVGGKFNVADHQNLVSISNPSGSATVNSSFRADSNIGSTVNTVSANGVGKLFVGGNFTSVGGVIRKNIAAIDLSTGQATGWTSPFTGIGDVTSIDSDGNYIYAGYDLVSGTSAPGVMKLGIGSNAGYSTHWSTGSMYYDHVSKVKLDNGMLYAGGTFTSFGAIPGMSNVARVNAGSENVDSNWKPVIGVTGATGSKVSQIAIDGSKVYLGGNFTAINGGTAMTSLVGIDGASGATGAKLADWNDPSSVLFGGIDSMLMIPAGTYSWIPNGAILASRTGTSSIQMISASGSYIGVFAALSTNMTKVTELVRSGDMLFIGGQANNTAPSLAQALMAYDLSGAAPLLLPGFDPSIQNTYTVNSVEVIDESSILVGGDFQQVRTTSGAGGMMSWGLGLFDASKGTFY